MSRRIRFSLLLIIGVSFPAAATDAIYRLGGATALPSTNTEWDYIKLEPDGPRLFMARRKDGLTVFDVDSNKVLATVENSVGANGPLLLPQFDRGYVAMTDGSLLSFKLKSLKVIDRIELAGDGGLNGVVFDPATRRIHAVVGARAAESAWFTLDAATGMLLGKTVFPFRKMDDPAPDGKGALYAPARYDNLLLKLDSRTLAEQARWPIDCVQVVAVEYQASHDRILIGCRGDAPRFIALDASTGRQLASIPIGKGIDGMVVDEKRGLILTSNGGDASMTVIRQEGPDNYLLMGNVQTRPQARTMQIDERNGNVYLVTADATYGAPDANGKVPAPYIHPDSFVLLRYKPVE